MTYGELYGKILEKRSFLCVGLDTDIRKLPPHLLKSPSPVLDFNRSVVDATHELAVAFKPNLAFYESRGAAGWEDLARTLEYIRSVDPTVFLIADAKRGDLGNTASLYARTFFEELDFDAVTVSPYMGRDSVQPFLEYPGKWVILLGMTSNPGAEDFQFLRLQEGGGRLYEEVLRKASSWADHDRMMFVAGATRAELISGIRQILPDHFLLVPGVGAQGGSLEEVARAGMNQHCGLLVNSSREILYEDPGPDFASAARQKALALREIMSGFLE
jgi:orotidine-5'-phosphate decarboxylase